MIPEIPATFRANARITAKRRLTGVTDSEKALRIINQIAEEEWALDRAEWRSYMNEARNRFYQMHATPQDRKHHEYRR